MILDANEGNEILRVDYIQLVTLRDGQIMHLFMQDEGLIRHFIEGVVEVANVCVYMHIKVGTIVHILQVKIKVLGSTIIKQFVLISVLLDGDISCKLIEGIYVKDHAGFQSAIIIQ